MTTCQQINIMAGAIKVFYHYICPDGLFAAFAAHLRLVKFPASTNTRPVRFIPHSVTATADEVEQSLDALEATDELFLLDFAGNYGFLSKASSRVNKVHLLDHHKTAMEELQALEAKGELPSNLERVVDMNRSGAMIAYDYFGIDKVKPELFPAFAMIQDQDLWRFEIETTKAFNAGLGSLALEYDPNKNPSLFDTLENMDVFAVCARGKAVIDEQNIQIARIISTAYPFSISAGTNNLSCLAVTVAAHETILRSEVGNQLAILSKEKGLDPAAAVISKERQGWKLSLRSFGDFDTTKVTKFYGGGGHLNASSCVVSEEILKDKIQQ